MSETTFKPGDRVTKTKGSNWTGRVVGTYSTALTPEGYAVESETEKGSVQIYPAAALTLAPALPDAVGDHCHIHGCLHKQYGSPAFPKGTNPFAPAPALPESGLGGWRDIGTAPKDGSQILVPGRFGLTTIACWWPAAHLQPDHSFRGDWDDGERDEDGGFTPFNPPAWMPLPAWKPALATPTPAPAPAPAPVDAAGLVARLSAKAQALYQTRSADDHAGWEAGGALWEATSALAAAAEREAALEEKVRQSALDYLALDMQATEALEREAALVRERDEALSEARRASVIQTMRLKGLEASSTVIDICAAYLATAQAAEARVTAAEAERDAERERCAKLVEDAAIRLQSPTLTNAAAAIRKETTA